MEKKEKVVVGVNKYLMQEELKIPLLKIDEEVEKQQVANVQKVRQERNQAEAQKQLQRIENRAREGGNLMEGFVNAVREYCTLGEIIEVLKGVFGEYKDPGML